MDWATLFEQGEHWAVDESELSSALTARRAERTDE